MWRITRWDPLHTRWVSVGAAPNERAASRSVRALAAKGHLSKATCDDITLTAYPARPERPAAFSRYELIDNPSAT